jgi:hypothetical protein
MKRRECLVQRGGGRDEKIAKKKKKRERGDKVAL